MSTVFISYARRTSAPAARQLAASLRARGTEVFLDESSIDDHVEFPRAIVSGILAANVFVGLFDDAYARSWYCIRELRIALAAWKRAKATVKQDGSKAPAIVLALGDHLPEKTLQSLPPDLRVRNWQSIANVDGIVDAVRNMTPDATFGVFLRNDEAEVRSLTEGARIPPPAKPVGQLFPVELPPSLGDRFVGHSDDLWAIHLQLVVLPRAQTGAGAATVLIEGIGGIGKSQLAHEYVHRFAPLHFRGGVLWLDAGVSEGEFVRQLRQLVRMIGGDATDDGELRSELAKWVAAQDDPVLLVVDNLPAATSEPLSHWCPLLGRTAVLVTSREKRSAWEEHVSAIEILPLADDDGAAMLMDGVDPHVAPSETWRKLARAVGGIPVALQLLNASIRLRGWDPDTLRGQIRKNGAFATLEDVFATLRKRLPLTQLRAIAGTFEVSFAALSKAARQAARRFATLSPAPIPHALAKQLANSGERIELTRHSIILPAAREEAGVFVFGQMHQLFAEYVNARGTGPRWFRRVEPALPTSWQRHRRNFHQTLHEVLTGITAILSNEHESEATLHAIAAHIESVTAHAERERHYDDWPNLLGAYASAVQRFSQDGRSHWQIIESLKGSVQTAVEGASTQQLDILKMADAAAVLEYPAVPGELEIGCYSVHDPTKKTADYGLGGDPKEMSEAMGKYGPRLEEIYRIRRTFRGEDHIATIAIASWLAFGFLSAKNDERAREWFGILYEGCKQRYGDRAINTLIALWRLLVLRLEVGVQTAPIYEIRDRELIWLLDTDVDRLDPRLRQLRFALAAFPGLTSAQRERAVEGAESAAAAAMKGVWASVAGNDPVYAHEHLTTAIDAGVDFPDAHLHRADAAISLGDYEAARRDLSEAEKRGSSIREIRSREVTIYMREGDPEGVERAASEAIAAGSSEWMDFFARGTFRRVAGRPAHAVADLRQAIKLTDGDPSNLIRIELAKAFADLKRFSDVIVTLDPVIRANDSVVALILRGEAYFELGKYDEADADARSCLKVQARNVDALVLAGRCLLQAGKLADARSRFKLALEVDPDDRRALIQSMIAALKAEDREAALDAAESLLKQTPGNRELLAIKATTLRKMDRLEDALTTLTELLGLTPDDDSARAERALTLGLLDRLEEMTAEGEELVRRHPENMNYRRGLVIGLDKLDRHEEAVGNYDLLIGTSPDEWELLTRRASHLVALNRIDGAVDDLKNALRLSDGEKSVAEILADVLFVRGRYDELLAALETIPAEKRDPQVNGWLGRAARLLDRVDDARRYYDLALTADPSLRGARLGRAYLERSLEHPYAALSDLDFHLRTHHNDPDFLAERASVLLDIGRRNDAAVDLAQLLKAPESEQPERSELGRLFARAGRFANAIEYYEQDLASNPDDGPRMSNLGEALLWDGRVDRAASLLEDALAREHDSWITFLRGVAAKLNGDDDLADRSVRTALAEISRAMEGGDDPLLAFNRALYLLALGDHELGIDSYRRTAAHAPLSRLREAFEDVENVRSALPTITGTAEGAKVLSDRITSKLAP